MSILGWGTYLRRDRVQPISRNDDPFMIKITTRFNRDSFSLPFLTVNLLPSLMATCDLFPRNDRSSRGCGVCVWSRQSLLLIWDTLISTAIRCEKHARRSQRRRRHNTSRRRILPDSKINFFTVHSLFHNTLNSKREGRTTQGE